MNFTTITTPNQKGQIVIPVKLRKSLNIDHTTPLKITQAGNSITLNLLNQNQPTKASRQAYIEILKHTKGAWANDQDKDETAQKRRQLELEAAKHNKKPW